MKQELRCHAVLCPSENKAKKMCKKLHERIHQVTLKFNPPYQDYIGFVCFQALIDFKKEKILRQNARLSLANSAYENPSMPNRKILLQTGSANYRAPAERGKSAPKLKAIEEAIFEEEEEAEQRCQMISSWSAEIIPQTQEYLGYNKIVLKLDNLSLLSNKDCVTQF